MPSKMQSFIHSALKLHADDIGFCCADTQITDEVQFNYMNDSYVGSLYDLSKQTQLNYLLLMAAEQGEFENSFVYSALKLFHHPYLCMTLADSRVTTIKQWRKIEKHFDTVMLTPRETQVNFLLLIAASEGEL